MVHDKKIPLARGVRGGLEFDLPLARSPTMRLVRSAIQLSCVCLIGAPPALASSPSGVWSLPDSVTILDEDEPQPMVVIEGLFTVWSGDGPVGGNWGMQGYEDAAWGFMVYRCKVDDKALCLMQWGEIVTAAGDDACVGWGDQETAAGSVRATGDTSSPDTYPLALGVVTGVTPCSYLATIPPREPVEPGPEPVAEPVPDLPTVPPEEAPVELAPEPGPEPVPEAAAEATTTTTAGDTMSGGDTAVTGDEAEGGGCVGGALPSLWGMLVALALARRRRA